MLPLYFVRDVPGLYPGGTPSPLFFVTAHSKGVTGTVSVSAHSKGLICTKMVQFLGVLGTAHSKGLSLDEKQPGNKKAADWLPLGANLPRNTITQSIAVCQGKRERAA